MVLFFSSKSTLERKNFPTEKRLGTRVVKDLIATIQHCSLQIYACGTIRSNLKHFSFEITPYLNCGFPDRGDSVTLQSEILPNLIISLWQDTTPVTVIASNCQAILLDSVTCKLKTGEHHTYSCPEAIKQYNKYMGGVDGKDQLRQYFHIRVKCCKYYKYLWWM
uniref:PiggyBac transposable element-derived protein domain-containing protein n=1 Tax=Amphimedon queenslandica TaxID=400682 RepID=A0A1X7V9C8_AMPQE